MLWRRCFNIIFTRCTCIPWIFVQIVEGIYDAPSSYCKNEKNYNLKILYTFVQVLSSHTFSTRRIYKPLVLWFTKGGLFLIIYSFAIVLHMRKNGFMIEISTNSTVYPMAKYYYILKMSGKIILQRKNDLYRKIDEIISDSSVIMLKLNMWTSNYNIK